MENCAWEVKSKNKVFILVILIKNNSTSLFYEEEEKL